MCEHQAASRAPDEQLVDAAAERVQKQDDYTGCPHQQRSWLERIHVVFVWCSLSSTEQQGHC